MEDHFNPTLVRLKHYMPINSISSLKEFQSYISAIKTRNYQHAGHLEDHHFNPTLVRLKQAHSIFSAFAQSISILH